jgi:hypothetical protein
MSHLDAFEPAEPPARRAGNPRPSQPDWLAGSDEGTQRKAEAPRPDEARAGDETATGGPVAWKAAASSVPRLRQEPAAREPLDPAAPDAFPGFAQDAIAEKSGARVAAGEPEPTDEPLDAPAGEGAMPLAADSPFWVDWLDRLRSLPRAVVLGVGAVLVVGTAALHFLHPGESRGVALAQIRQQPEAFEGRSVRVSGRAGEAFAVGANHVFDLYQDRDTIVVYSRSRPPRLNEKVEVDGIVSVGYLDGVPRVAVLEDPPAR